MATKSVDILIVGGGLIGASLMLALNGLGLSTLLVESQALDNKINPDFDARSLALSPASIRILSMLGLWENLQDKACPIEKIHVSEQGRFGVARLEARESSPLGYVLEMHYINAALQDLLEPEKLLSPATLTALDTDNTVATINTPSEKIQIKAQLIVAADGVASAVRTLSGLDCKIKDYHQQALVANIGLERPHHQCAFERFTPHGPLALLPMQANKMSLVWAMKPNEAKAMLELDDKAFLKSLQMVFGYRLGRLIKVGKRFSYPLKQSIMPELAKWPLLFIGNAAHTLHPVAGQGFNLGLRDVAMLAQCIAKSGLNEAMLSQFLRLRRSDHQKITQFTDGLVSLFTSQLPGLSLLRNLGLIAFDNSPALKKSLSRFARGFGGVNADLTCGLPLEVENEPFI